MIQATRRYNLSSKINIRNHEIISGVSESLGGNDEGLDPHELLESALAACTIITMQMYANRKGYNLESSFVEIKIDSEGAQTHFTRMISLKGNLSAEERSKILEIAEKCPIHRLLTSQVSIDTKVI